MDESVTKGLELNGRDADINKNRMNKISVTGYDTSMPLYDLDRALRKHFSSCGEIITVCIPRADVGCSTLNRFSFIEIVGEGAGEKALQLSGTDVGGWNVLVKVIPSSGNFNPEGAAYRAACDRNRRSVGFFVSGYDTSLPDKRVGDLIRALRKHFSSCGEITDFSISRNHLTGALHRSALIYILGEGAAEKALKLDGSDVGGWNVLVKALPLPTKLTDILRKRSCVEISVTGYDTSLPEDDINCSLRKHFASCGEVMDVFFTRNHETGALDSKALIYIMGERAAAKKAKELSGSDMGGCKVVAKVISLPDKNWGRRRGVLSGYTVPDRFLTKKAKMTAE